MTTISRDKLPPMMQRYLDVKAQHEDKILFFQVGDFYELFFEDAVRVAKELNLTLTSRDKNDPNPIPMCGFPVAVIDTYLDRLVSRGYSAVVVSQAGPVEQGKIMERMVERILTPGIRLFTTVSSDSSAQSLAAISLDTFQNSAVASVELETGMVRVSEYNGTEALIAGLQSLDTKEVILPRISGQEKLDRRTGWVRLVERSGATLTFRGESPVDIHQDRSRTLDGFAGLSALGKRAVRALVAYLDETSVGKPIPLKSVSNHKGDSHLIIDSATRKNLELVQNAHDGSEHGTLLEYLNATSNQLGRRLLRSWIISPEKERILIQKRLKGTETLLKEASKRRSLRGALSRIADTERIALRLDMLCVTPKELGALRDSWRQLKIIRNALDGLADSALLQEMRDALPEESDLLRELDAALAENPPHVIGEGPVIKTGFDPHLDSIRSIRQAGDSWFRQFEEKERRSTGISSLKVKQNGVIGYFLEVTPSHLTKVPPHYIRRQSTVTCERFTTEELRDRERSVNSASVDELALERKLFEGLRENLKNYTEELRGVSQAVALLDVLSGFAEISERDDLRCPEISDDTVLEIESGKHPVLARKLGAAFVPNDLHFDASRVAYLLTGPNMGGKSTYLRQAALIVLMTQIGCFVPAKIAKVGIVDRIFARIGASDDIHEGDSTFMVEMREASHIIKSSTAKSLVLIDEIGRGTATADGLALAQAILEYLTTQKKSRTIFATHYHELTGLGKNVPGLKNISVGAVERDGEIFFTHEIVSGATSSSYGIEVARLAGLEPMLLDRARALVNTHGKARKAEQLPLFATSPEPLFSKAIEKTPSALVKLKEFVDNLEPDDLTPREAHEMMYELKALVKKEVANA